VSKSSQKRRTNIAPLLHLEEPRARLDRNYVADPKKSEGPGYGVPRVIAAEIKRSRHSRGDTVHFNRRKLFTFAGANRARGSFLSLKAPGRCSVPFSGENSSNSRCLSLPRAARSFAKRGEEKKESEKERDKVARVSCLESRIVNTSRLIIGELISGQLAAQQEAWSRDNYLIRRRRISFPRGGFFARKPNARGVPRTRHELRASSKQVFLECSPASPASCDPRFD